MDRHAVRRRASLADAAKESGTVEPREAARIGLHVLGALRAAHAAGVLHRDVKPGNILLARDGRVLITDFGIAAIEGDSTITRTGEIVGSIDYLAPERVKGADPGPASDLWSLGATLYTAVEGTSPFRRSSPISTMQAVVTEEPPYPEKAGALAPSSWPCCAGPGAAAARGRGRADAARSDGGRAPASAQAYVPTQRVVREDADRAEDASAGNAPVDGARTSDEARTADRPHRSEPGAAGAAGSAGSAGTTEAAPRGLHRPVAPAAPDPSAAPGPSPSRTAPPRPVRSPLRRRTPPSAVHRPGPPARRRPGGPARRARRGRRRLRRHAVRGR